MNARKARYPWYSYVNSIMYNKTKRRTQKELAAVSAVLEAADPETRALVDMVFITRSKNIREAARAAFVSYETAKKRLQKFRIDVARNLDLLEE